MSKMQDTVVRMIEKMDKAPAASYRTDMLRKQGMVRIALFHEFRRMHPEINLDEDQDMTDDQEAAWVEFSQKTLEAFGINANRSD